MGDCLLCRGSAGDAELSRVQVWADELWRLTTSLGPAECVPGFSYLEPRRHVPHITDLDGAEAQTFGAVLARCTRALQQAAGAELVYVYVFGGGIPHLHVHLAPHRAGDALSGDMIKGETEQRRLDSGAVAIVSKDYPAVPEAELRSVVARVRALLTPA